MTRRPLSWVVPPASLVLLAHAGMLLALSQRCLSRLGGCLSGVSTHLALGDVPFTTSNLELPVVDDDDPHDCLHRGFCILCGLLGRSRRMDLVRYRFREPQACTSGYTLSDRWLWTWLPLVLVTEPHCCWLTASDV